MKKIARKGLMTLQQHINTQHSGTYIYFDKQLYNCIYIINNDH